MQEDCHRCMYEEAEGVKELKIIPVTEQFSRVEKASSYGRNYSELLWSGRAEVEANHEAITLYIVVECFKQDIRPYD